MKRKLHMLSMAFLFAFLVVIMSGKNVQAAGYIVVNGGTAASSASVCSLEQEYVTTIQDGGVNYWYGFRTLAQDAYYYLETKNIDVKTHTWSSELKAEICNEFGEVIYGNSHIQSSDPRVSNRKLEPNTTYYLRIRDDWHEGAGNFKFKITAKVDQDKNEQENSTVIQLNEQYNRSMDGNGDFDWFTFKTDHGTKFVLTGKNIDVDTHTWSSDCYFRITLLNTVREEITQLRLTEGSEGRQVVELAPNTQYYIRIENHWEGDLYHKDNSYLFSIAKPVITEENVTVADNKYVYNGKKKKPGVTVLYDGQELIAGKDYKVTYNKNKDAGKATVIVTGRGSYIGTVKKQFIIERATQKIKTKKSSYIKKAGDKSFKISASAKGKISFISTNKKVATVDANGLVKVKKAGKTTIKIKAAAVKNYKAASKKIRITVKAKK